ncbi:MAG: hypothetical protein V4581_12555 [Bacteroidota bacterium]
MKKILLLLLLAAAPVFAQNTTFNPIGKWQATDKGEAISITFDKEGYVTMQRGTEVIGGKSFDMEGVKGSMTYKFDPEGVKGHLDMIMMVLDTQESRTLMALYKVVSPDEIVIAIDGIERPENFDSKDALTFKRVK